MPFGSEHRARQLPPGDFVTFRRQPLDRAPEGIEGIFGVRGDEAAELVEIVFDADTWAPAVAKRWLEDRGFKTAGFQVAQAQAVELIVMKDQAGAFEDRRVNVARFDRLPPDGIPTKQVRRWDLMALEKPTKTDLGLRAQGMITRTGVFVYTMRDGTKVRELRPPEAVFDSASLASFGLVPLTLDHPPDNLTQETVKDHQVGTVGLPVKVGDHARSDILITDSKAIEEVEAGKNQLSCGYDCRVAAHSGVYTDSAGVDHRFDAVQSKIEGNHVAIVDRARAGPSAQIRIDEADGYMSPQQKDENMEEVEVKIGDTVYKVPKAVADALKAKGDEDPPKDPPKDPDPEDPPKDDKADSAKLIAKMAAQNQAQAGKIAALEAERSDDAKRQQSSADQEKINARIVLLGKAGPVLGTKLDDLQKLSDAEIRRQVVAKKAPTVKLDGASDDFVSGIFEHVTAETKVDTAGALAQLTGDAKDDQRKDDDHQRKADTARDQMIQASGLAWMSEADRKAHMDRLKERDAG